MANYKNDEKDYMVYVLAELSYEKMCDEAGIDEERRYPPGWYASRDYHRKVELIAAALERKVRLAELTDGDIPR